MKFIFLALKLVLSNNIFLGIYYFFRNKFLRNNFVDSKFLKFKFLIKLSDESVDEYFSDNLLKKKTIKISDDFINGKVKIYQKYVNYKDFKVSKFSSFSKEFPGKDIRFLWELYRNKCFFNIGLSYRFSNDEKISSEVFSYISNFEDFCPIINKSCKIPYCAMEASIRLYNLYWIPYFFSKSPNYKIIDDKIKYIFQNYLNYIWNNYEITNYGLESNHCISDAFGLILGASVLPEHPMSKKWFAFGKKIILRSSKKQFFNDGINFESSIHYHRFVFEMLMLSYLIFKINDIDQISDFKKDLKKIGLSLLELSHSNFMIPRFGDNDGGKMFYDLQSLEDFHLLKYMNWFNGSSEIFTETLVFSEHLDLNFFLHPIEQFSISNYIIFKNKNISLIAPKVPIGSNGKGNHQHNDFLSFELYGKFPFIVDPWSFCYSGDANLRNNDRSIIKHNTICIDNREIVPFVDDRLFEMLGNIKINEEFCQSNDEISNAIISHDGYKDLKNGSQLHQRSFSFYKKINKIQIIDTLSGKGRHTGEISFFIPKNLWNVSKEKNTFIFENDFEKFIFSCSLVQMELLENYISPNFLSKEDAYNLKGVFNYQNSMEIKTIINHHIIKKY